MSEDCVCIGNWRQLVKECEGLVGTKYLSYDGKAFTFFGLVSTDEDYYYGMYHPDNGLRLLSCVGSIDGHGYVLTAK